MERSEKNIFFEFCVVFEQFTFASLCDAVHAACKTHFYAHIFAGWKLSGFVIVLWI